MATTANTASSGAASSAAAAATAAAAAASSSSQNGNNGTTSSTTATATASAAAAAAVGQKPPIFNPISRWEEPLELPSLTLFDVHRRPRQVNNDPNARVRIPLKVLGPEFHCPVCLGYMKKTSIVMECLHRFCGECIQKCLRLGKKECPSCRIHIPSRRSLRPDPNFDDLINNIYGDIDALEDYEEKEIENLNKAKNMNNAYAESRKRGIMQQAIHRKKKTQGGKEKAAPTSGVKRKSPGGATASGPSGPTIVGLEESTLIEYVVRRHPQETLVDRLDREYLRTSRDLPMHILKKFLGQKLSYQPYSHFQV